MRIIASDLLTNSEKEKIRILITLDQSDKESILLKDLKGEKYNLSFLKHDENVEINFKNLQDAEEPDEDATKRLKLALHEAMQNKDNNATIFFVDEIEIQENLVFIEEVMECFENLFIVSCIRPSRKISKRILPVNEKTFSVYLAHQYRYSLENYRFLAYLLKLEGLRIPSIADDLASPTYGNETSLV